MPLLRRWILCALCALCAALLATFAVSAHATVIYKYVGNPFTFIDDEDPPAGTYTTEMKVTGQVELASPIPPSSSVSISSVLSFSFNDGRRTINDATVVDRNSGIFLTTDSSGVITLWTVALATRLLNPAVGEQRAGIVSFAADVDLGVVQECTGLDGTGSFCSSFSEDRGAVQDPEGGTWTLVPEPASAALLSLGLLGLVVPGRLARRAPSGSGSVAASLTPSHAARPFLSQSQAPRWASLP